MNSFPLLTTIVLAGGQSTRMGQDKALILMDGVPLLRRTCEVGLQCSAEVQVVTAWPERYQAIVPPKCRLIQEHQSHGPLVGFAQALAQVQTEWVLLLACDLPRLKVEVLQAGVEQLNCVNEIAFLSKGDRGWEPLCGFYRTSCLPSLERSVSLGHRSFQRWLTEETVREWQGVDRSMLFNCNTPEDLKQI